jgi:hypothetical protein
MTRYTRSHQRRGSCRQSVVQHARLISLRRLVFSGPDLLLLTASRPVAEWPASSSTRRRSSEGSKGFRSIAATGTCGRIGCSRGVAHLPMLWQNEQGVRYLPAAAAFPWPEWRHGRMGMQYCVDSWQLLRDFHVNFFANRREALTLRRPPGHFLGRWGNVLVQGFSGIQRGGTPIARLFG